MFWPQIVRGASVMFCLLPPTRLALGHLEAAKIPDASGLFNLMRNLGGAIGLALIDTVIYGRAPIHAEALKTQLIAGDRHVLAFLNIPWDAYLSHSKAPLDPQTEMAVKFMIEHGASTKALNEAWALMVGLMVLAVLAAPCRCLLSRKLRRQRRLPESWPNDDRLYQQDRDLRADQ